MYPWFNAFYCAFKSIMPLLLGYNKTKGAESQGVGKVHVIRKDLLSFVVAL